MSKTKGFVVTTGVGDTAEHGAVFVQTLDEALMWADDFAVRGHSGYIMKVKGVYSFEPYVKKVERIEYDEVVEATPGETMDDWSELLP